MRGRSSEKRNLDSRAAERGGREIRLNIGEDPSHFSITRGEGLGEHAEVCQNEGRN